MSIKDIKFELMVDSVSYKGRTKPQGSELGAIRNRLSMPKAHQQLNIEQLEQVIKKGCTIMPGVCNAGTKLENWCSQQLFLLDFDNDEEVKKRGFDLLDPDVALERAYDKDLDPLFLYFSHSATIDPWNPRYRMVFGLKEPETNKLKAQKIADLLCRVFPEADRGSNQLNRMYLCPGGEVWPCWMMQLSD